MSTPASQTSLTVAAAVHSVLPEVLKAVVEHVKKELGVVYAAQVKEMKDEYAAALKEMQEAYDKKLKQEANDYKAQLDEMTSALQKQHSESTSNIEEQHGGIGKELEEIKKKLNAANARTDHNERELKMLLLKDAEVDKVTVLLSPIPVFFVIKD